MKEIIGALLALLAFALFVGGIALLIRPAWGRDRKTGEVPSRLKILVGTSFVPLALMLVAGSLLPSSKREAPSRKDSSAAVPATDNAPTTDRVVAAPASEAATPPPAPTAELEPKAEEVAVEFDLRLTPEQFRRRFNAQIRPAGKHLELDDLDLVKGEVNDVFRATGDGFFVIGTISRQTGMVQGLTLGVGNAGTKVGNMQSVVAVVAGVHAVTRRAKKEGVSKAVMAVISEALDDIDADDASPAFRIVGENRISAVASRHVGLLVTIRRDT